MNKSELIEAFAAQRDISHKRAEEVVNMIFNSMSEAMINGERIEIRGLGSFVVKEYGAYTGRNPKTGEAVALDLPVRHDDVLIALLGRALARLPRDEADALANLHWSAKEAALKVLQLGLRVDTHRVHVTLDAQPVWTGWNTLSVEALDQHFPGYWRRFGQFVLTVCFAPGGRPDSPPALLHGGADLTAAEPMHTWVQRPLVGGGQ